MEKRTTKEMINDCIFLAMGHIKKEIENAKFADQKVALCQGMEFLARAYQNVNL